MKHVAAYALLVLSGKPHPTKDEVSQLMRDCGVSVDEESLDHMIKQFEGKKAHEMIKEGSEKVVAMPAGGVGGGSSGAAAAEVKEEVKEEKKEEEEVDVDMGGLFGGDDDDY